jgi:two-component system cell cycle sensor histidine kinase PleC
MFGNLRLFSLLSFVVIIVIAVVVGVAFRNLATDELVRLVEQHDKNIGEGYVDTVWKPYRGIIHPLASGDPSLMSGNPQVAQFAQETVRYFQHMSLYRVNIYAASGLLLLSVDIAPVSKTQKKMPSPDMAFVKGNTSSMLMTSKLSEMKLPDDRSLALVQTLVPIVVPGENSPDGMVEMLYDVTAPLEKQVDFQLYGTASVVALFLAFWGMLFLSSRRSENIIARQHEANLELAAAAAAAQTENREKSQFLANVSHELRTPLNAIIGFSDIIKNGVMPLVENKKYKDYIADINGSGVHLLSLINDILDYSKAEAGKLEMEVSEVNASKLIQNSMRLVEPRAETAKVRLLEALPKEPIIITTDSKKFKQILLNLLSNAVKFTPADGEIRISAWRDLADDTVTFEVKDSGIGIAPKDISRAMSPFGQVDSALSRKYEGTGLGLPLTKKFVELMGGKFTIESQLNVGTTITFTLPRELKEVEGVIIKQVA